MITVKRQGGIIQIMIIELLGLLKTFRRQKTAKMLKFCSKVKKVLNSAGNVKSAKRYRDMSNDSCFQFPLGVTVVPREIEDDGYAKFGREG